MDILDHGHWDPARPKRFIFNEPQDLGDGHVMRSCDLTEASVEEGIAPEDIVHAILSRFEVNGELT